MTRRLAIASATMLLALVVAGAARAAAFTHPTLNAAATEAAGRPVNVACELDDATWLRDYTRGVHAAGFWSPAAPDWLWLGPIRCRTFAHLLSGRTSVDVGLYPLAEAIFTLAHEAVHARFYGGDEGVVDCTAMPLVRGLAVRHFGLPESTTTETINAGKRRVVVRVKVKRKWRRFVRYVDHWTIRYVTVPNPDLARFESFLLPIHRAKPPEYQGTC